LPRGVPARVLRLAYGEAGSLRAGRRHSSSSLSRSAAVPLSLGPLVVLRLARYATERTGCGFRRSRTAFRREVEHHSGGKPNRIPG
jgi:hypothetical protein